MTDHSSDPEASGGETKRDRLERLLDLTATLLDAERPLTRNELLARVPGYPPELESARRQLNRDLTMLRELGFPIETTEREAEPGDRHVYALQRDGYHLPDLGLTEDEAAALQLAVAAIGAAPTTVARRAIHKLGGADARVSLPAAAADLDVPEVVVDLFGALGDRRQVQLTYKGEARTLDPWGLSSASGRWYLRAFDHGRLAPRTFRIDRIEGAVEVLATPGAFERPSEGAAGGPPPPWLLGEDVELVAELLVDASSADQAVLAAGVDALSSRHPDGSVTLRLPVANRDALRSFVVGFLDTAEVVGPPELRADIVAWLQSMTSGAAPTGSVA